MSELGQQLREARLQKGMSLDDVQEMTKIRKRYLEAIEAGDYKVLPGSFYVRAFIKTYAETVGLNPDGCWRDTKRRTRRRGGSNDGTGYTEAFQPSG